MGAPTAAFGANVADYQGSRAGIKRIKRTEAFLWAQKPVSQRRLDTFDAFDVFDAFDGGVRPAMTHFAPIPDKPGIVARWIAMVLTVKQCLQALLMLMIVVVAPTVMLGLLTSLWGPPVAAVCLLLYALLVFAVVWCCDIGA